MPHPSIITHLCIKGGITFNRYEEKTCPKTSLLTLTTFTKPSSNKGKGKLKEVEDEGRNGNPDDHARVASIENRKHARQGSASLD